MAELPDTMPDSEIHKAVSFIRDVKARFAENVYEEFLLLLRSIITGADHDKVKAEVYELLQGHPDLIRGFDAFCPAPEPARQGPAPTRPKRERRPTAAAIDADTGRILDYFTRVKDKGGDVLYDRLLALILQLGSEKTVDANQIYERARAVFGTEHDGFLREFTEYLPVPTGRDREFLLRRRAKKEPSPEEHRAPAPKRKTAVAVAVAADNNHPSAAKRPRTDDRKTTTTTNRRRANSPVPAVPVFRETWEFETTYWNLVETKRRTEKLLKQYEPTKKNVPLRRGRSFEDLFPSRECQEVLREMYHGMFRPIREALEDDKRIEPALRTIHRRLEMLEQVGVKVAMERRDRCRVEGRMNKLAVDRMLILCKKAAKQRAGA